MRVSGFCDASCKLLLLLQPENHFPRKRERLAVAETLLHGMSHESYRHSTGRISPSPLSSIYIARSERVPSSFSDGATRDATTMAALEP